MALAKAGRSRPTAEARAARRRSWIRRVLLALGPAVVALGAGYFYVTGGRYVSTDNAYVKADMAGDQPEVSGPIVKVEVRENQHVEPGSFCSGSTTRPSRSRSRRPRRASSKADDDIRALKASYRQKQQELELAHKNVAYRRARVPAPGRMLGQSATSSRRPSTTRRTTIWRWRTSRSP